MDVFTFHKLYCKMIFLLILFIPILSGHHRMSSSAEKFLGQRGESFINTWSLFTISHFPTRPRTPLDSPEIDRSNWWWFEPTVLLSSAHHHMLVINKLDFPRQKIFNKNHEIQNFSQSKKCDMKWHGKIFLTSKHFVSFFFRRISPNIRDGEFVEVELDENGRWNIKITNNLKTTRGM